MSRRSEKVASLIKQEVSHVLQTELRDPNVGFVTVTRVGMSGDLKRAVVHVSVLGRDKDRDQTVEHLNHAAGFIQKELSSRVTLRYLPKLVFKLDESLDRSMHIEGIIKRIHEQEDSSNTESQDE